MINATVTYYELSNYNNGDLIAKTFELSGLDHDEHLTQVSEWLEDLTEKTGENCEEIIIADYEDIPAQYVGEWSIDPDFFEYQEFIENTHLASDVVEAGTVLGIPFDKMEDAYFGEFGSDEEIGRYYAEESGLLNDIPENIEMYFNYSDYGRDLAINSFSEHDGYYFYNSAW